jgi:hypothetical protein
LSYCLRSIHRFASGFSEIVVLIPEGSNLPLTKERLVKVQDYGHGGNGYYDQGYIGQQIFKMNADKYCQSDFVCHMDSDSIFVKPVTPNDLMVNGKPLWLMTPMEEVIAKDKNAHAHATSIRNFSGIDSEFEYMRRIGQIVPRWAYGCFREYALEKHKKTFAEWALAQPFRGVTEFNFLGQYLHREFPNFIHFHDTRFGLPECFVHQRWSWSGLNEETRKELELELA